MIQKPKGTRDIFKDVAQWQQLELVMRSVCDFYNYKEIRTPIFESLDLFKRAVGNETDVVSKEMYDFKDKGGRDIALRPENTAGVVRAYIENKMFGTNPLTKLFYMGPQFRYERPQGGRQRQFNQFGAEAIGIKSPRLDVEQILLAYTILQTIGLKSLDIQINTLGDVNSRTKYKEVLREYMKKNSDKLCEDCNRRIDTNVLRVLDCKKDADSQVFKDAPKLTDYLSLESKGYFTKVKGLLMMMDIPFTVNNKLVRGLDYYSETVFEIISTSTDNAQSTLCGGGRYDGLVAQLGGPDLSGVGFAMGLERILISLEAEGVNIVEDNGIDVYIVTLNEETKDVGLAISAMIRSAGFICEIDFAGASLKSQFKSVERTKAKVAIIIGEDELKAGEVKFKIQSSQIETSIKMENIVEELDKLEI